MKILRLIIITLAIVASSVSAAAQSHIKSELRKLENRTEGVYAVVTERRNPANGKLYKISQVFKFRNNNWGKALVEAFDRDRQKSYSCSRQVSNSGRTIIYTCVFTKDGNMLKYCIIRDGDIWTVSASEQYPKNAPRSESLLLDPEPDPDEDIFLGNITNVIYSSFIFP